MANKEADQRPCASCRIPAEEEVNKASKTQWIATDEGKAVWLHNNNIVRSFFERPTGFYVTLQAPNEHGWLWLAQALDASYTQPMPARVAYTGSPTGTAIQRVLRVRPGEAVRVRAPCAYHDHDDQGSVLEAFPPHAHFVADQDSTKQRFSVVTLPFMVPECDYATAVSVATNAASPWVTVYVGENEAGHQKHRLGPNTHYFKRGEGLLEKYKKANPPMLLYCEHAKCDLSHTVAKSLMQAGISMAAVYVGGLQDIEMQHKKKESPLLNGGLGATVTLEALKQSLLAPGSGANTQDRIHFNTVATLFGRKGTQVVSAQVLEQNGHPTLARWLWDRVG